MAKSVNKVFLLGNVGKDPEIRSTTGGTMVASFTLAPATAFRTSKGTGRTARSGIISRRSTAPRRLCAIT